jgi:hypothetical protein
LRDLNAPGKARSTWLCTRLDAKHRRVSVAQAGIVLVRHYNLELRITAIAMKFPGHSAGETS